MTPEIADLLQRPWVAPKDIFDARLLPLSLNGIYEAIARGDIESFRIGKKFVVPTAPLRRKLGIDTAA